MNRFFLSLSCFLSLPCLLAASLVAQGNPVIKQLDERSDFYGNIAQRIWENPELGYLEEQSATLLQQTLADAGFRITSPVAGIPTAFIAEFGSGQPVIAILAEYDALPGASQAAVPHRQPRVEGGAGHACGHHLFGVASVASAIAVKDWMVANNAQGTVRVYGTPAEEGGSGKVYIARAGLLDDVDVIIHWHPAGYNGVRMTSSLANTSIKFRFFGEAAHASGAPERGRSALDAVEAMNFMVNMMREHVPQETRMHYIITKGGEAPNVVPDFAESYHYVRHPDAATVKEIVGRMILAAEGAAMGTQTRVEYEIIGGVHSVLLNAELAKVMQKHLEEVGGVIYDEAELAFAEAIAETMPETVRVPLQTAAEVRPLPQSEGVLMSSTDVGDMSWLVPTVGMRSATWVPGTAAHSWQATAAGGMGIGSKGMMVAAKTMALTAIDILQEPSVIEKAKLELNERRGANFKYEPLVGDREPPLDYRK